MICFFVFWFGVGAVRFVGAVDGLKSFVHEVVGRVELDSFEGGFLCFEGGGVGVGVLGGFESGGVGVWEGVF